MYTSTESMSRTPVVQTAPYRMEHDPFMRQMMNALRCPSYLGPEEVILAIADLKTQISEIEHVQQQNAGLLDRTRRELAPIANYWVSSLSGVSGDERDLTMGEIGMTLKTASVGLQDRATQDQKLFFDKHIPRLQQRLQQADEIDAIDEDTQQILAERDEMITGTLVRAHKVKDRSFQQYMQSLDKRAGQA